MVVAIYNLISLYKPRYTCLQVTCSSNLNWFLAYETNVFISNQVLLSMPHVSKMQLQQPPPPLTYEVNQS